LLKSEAIQCDTGDPKATLTQVALTHTTKRVAAFTLLYDQYAHSGI